MGDRVSIEFRNGDQKSPVLFNHWGGPEFPEVAAKYAWELIKESNGRTCLPIERLEPGTVMVDFIRHILPEWEREGRVQSSLYLCREEREGDNSDNGHYVIDITGGRVWIDAGGVSREERDAKREALKDFEATLTRAEANAISKESIKRPLTPGETRRFKKVVGGIVEGGQV